MVKKTGITLTGTWKNDKFTDSSDSNYNAAEDVSTVSNVAALSTIMSSKIQDSINFMSSRLSNFSTNFTSSNNTPGGRNSMMLPRKSSSGFTTTTSSSTNESYPRPS